MKIKNTFLYLPSIWLIRRLRVVDARTDRPCDICQLNLFQNEDYPGEYLKINVSSTLCVRCAFRLVSHPAFKDYYTLTYDEIQSSDFDSMALFKKLREVYKFDRIYKDLIREDRQSEGRTLSKRDFDDLNNHYELEWIYTKSGHPN